MRPTCGPPARCFQGVVPAAIATSSRAGVPNVTYLSQVFDVDERHVALSCQFFNKTKQNVLENPFACVVLNDPLTFEAYRLEVRYLRSEASGPLFDAMAMRIRAIASQTGMTGVFKLLSADVYEVLRCEKLDGFIEVPDAPDLDDPGGQRGELRGLQLISQRACRARDLDALVAAVLEGLDEALGFEHVMLLMPDETGERLFTVASRGYGAAGVGAEVAMDEGLIGTVARERRILRISGVDAELRYGRTVRSRIAQTGERRALEPEIPLPGLPDAQSHLALPLVVGDRLVGVLAVESRERLGFDEWDETFLEIVANQVAVGLDNAILRERADDDAAGPATSVPDGAQPFAPSRVEGRDRALRRTRQERAAPMRTRRFRFIRHDDCVFVDDDYLIRNVPGRILWKLLRAHVDTGRTEFSNRELRLDPWLGLPQLRDNLESRLVLLRKRLELKCPDLRLPSTSRGHFRIEAACAIELEESE
ncbi:MAG: GAF domain-containing protein [Deltaproteobacteria bacterium]|nr:GAF domain-containing protein [Deltaproteobacteria bacterium]